jgi:hypothetical protein
MKKITLFGAIASVLPALLAALFATSFAAAQGADDLAWPRSAKAGAETLTIFQPQIERWNGAEIACQAAVSIQTGQEPPLYGVAQLSAIAEADKAARTVAIRNLQLARVTFATAPEKDAAYLEGFRKLLPAGAKTVPLDKLEASLALTDAVKRQLALSLRSDVPAIIFTTVPTVLVLVDGQPALQPMTGLGVERVVNTRALIVKLNGLFYLTALNYWYEAAAIEGPWAPTDEPPAILARARRDAPAQVDLMGSAAAAPGAATPPALRVSTVPAELIQTAGPPQMLPVEGTFLLQVRNTRDAIFVDLNSNLHYAQLSGRWYRTKSPYYGPWESVPADRLPADFAKIPAPAEPAAPPEPPVAAAQPKFPAPSAIVVPPPESYVIQQPPPPPIEAIPACPGPGYVWTGGYWDWGPRGWLWIGGRWGVGVDIGPIGVWFGGGHFWRGGHGGGGHRR